MSALAVVVSLVAAAWAALLALAEESPRVARALGDPAASGREDSGPAGIHVFRLILLLVSAIAAGGAVGWWQRPLIEGLGAAAIATGFLYMIAEALPRAVGAMAPDVAAAAAGQASRTLVPFRGIARMVASVERRASALVPVPEIGETTPASGQRDLLLGVFALGATTVAEIMTPRLDIVSVPRDADWRDVLDVVRRSEHARLPVVDETLDHIRGILYAKDLVASVGGAAPIPARWQELVHAAEFVPESKSLAVQLQDFLRGSSHIAIVVDEFGGTSGLVTLEDVLEEVVGEIRDEYDEHEQPAVEREGDDKFWIDGSVTLDELSALLGERFERDDASTVAGLVYSELGRVPLPGEEFHLGPYRIVVEQVVRRRIRRVYFERASELEEMNVPAEGIE